MNDVLLAALHIPIADWNEEHRTGARRIAVMVPVNLRLSHWQQEVVGNVLLPVRDSTGPSDRSSPMAVLEAVVEQSRRIKEAGTGGALIEVLGRSTSMPVEAKDASPPLLRARLRPGCLSACRSEWSPSADGSMPSPRSAHPLFGRDAAARFADGYVEALERFLAL